MQYLVRRHFQQKTFQTKQSEINTIIIIITNGFTKSGFKSPVALFSSQQTATGLQKRSATLLS